MKYDKLRRIKEIYYMQLKKYKFLITNFDFILYILGIIFYFRRKTLSNHRPWLSEKSKSKKQR